MTEHRDPVREVPSMKPDAAPLTAEEEARGRDLAAAALALSEVAHDLVPGIRHDFGLVAEDALQKAGWLLVRASRDADAAWEALTVSLIARRQSREGFARRVARHRPAIEAAIRASGSPEPVLDVERLARAMEDVFPGWLDEAPGTAEAQAEMRDYARQLGEAYEFLRDSASPGAALAPSEPTDG